MRHLVLLPLVLMLGCATTEVRHVVSPGSSKQSAIEVCRPDGQRAYLARLSCADGSRPGFKRVGSFGPRYAYSKEMSQEEARTFMMAMYTPLKPGQADHHTVDQYELSCGATKTLVFMDMYHCDHPAPTEAPSGFSIRQR